MTMPEHTNTETAAHDSIESNGHTVIWNIRKI